jgi:hypothetical protein
VFELFYRDPDSSRAVAGSGIGLFVCASLVEAMGGRIWASRPPGGGSEVGFTLRALEPDPADADAPSRAPHTAVAVSRAAAPAAPATPTTTTVDPAPGAPPAAAPALTEGSAPGA